MSSFLKTQINSVSNDLVSKIQRLRRSRVSHSQVKQAKEITELARYLEFIVTFREATTSPPPTNPLLARVDRKKIAEEQG